MNKIPMILRYHGAKWRIARWIIDKFPEHHSYIEPFFGSGAVFFKKDPAPIETINDISGDVVNLFRVVREQSDNLARAVFATPYSREEYEQCCISSSDDPVERARIFLVLHWQGFGYRDCTKSGWKRDVNGREAAYAMREWYRLPYSIISVVDRLKTAQIECRPALDLIQEYNKPNVLIYCDPPYVMETRRGKQYANEMTDQDHVRLLKALNDHKGTVAISGYDCNLYREMLSGEKWTRYEINALAERGAHRTEVLWLNTKTKNKDTLQIQLETK